MKKLIDANIIIRFLIADDKKKADAIEKLLKSKEKFILTDVAISEIIWILSSYYQEERTAIVKKITALIDLSQIKGNKKILLLALSYFKEYNVDWIDAYLAAFAEYNKIKEIYSYDKDLDKIKTIKRKEP